MQESRSSIKVWDPLVRTGHWLLAGAFFTAWVTGDEGSGVHVWSGYLLGAIVALRIVWGFVGTRHARFTDFVRSPLAAFRYLRSLLSGRSDGYLGHNPAAGWMIVLLLLTLGGTVVSGMAVLAAEEGTGPFAGLSGSAAPASVTAMVEFVLPTAHADDGEDEKHGDRASGHGGPVFGISEDAWEEAHEVLANATLFLVLVHVLGVVLSSLAHRENLVLAMVTGRKRREEEE